MSFDPVSLGTLITIAGTVAGGGFSLAQGQYQAKVAEANAEIADENAKRALERSQIEQIDQDQQTLALLGEQEAYQGASGLSLMGKSQIRTRATARRLGRRDALNVRQAGDIEAYNYKTQGMNFRAEGAAAKTSGLADFVGSMFSAAGKFPSLLSDAQGVAAPSRYVPRPIPKPRLYG